MAQSYLRNPSVERLPELLEQLHTRTLCIPPFHRDFEWNGEQRLALCDSVRLGLPTGSLLVWRTSRELATGDPIGPYSLDPPVGAVRQYLLDGRQRMTTLYAALAAGFWTREGKIIPKAHPSVATPPDGTPWAIMFDLVSEQFAFEQRIDAGEGRRPSLRSGGSEYEGAAEPNLMPLAVVLDDIAYDEWRRKAHLSRDLANRARALRSAFMDYLIPVVPLATDDIAMATLTYKRINSGTLTSDAAMTRVLAWSTSFDLRAHIDAARQRLSPGGWSDVDDNAFLKVVAAVSKLDANDVDPELLARKIAAEPGLVQTAGERVRDAAEFLLKRLGIAGPGALPYTHILVFMTRAMDRAGGRLTSDQEHKLAAWVAETCIDERFGGAPARMVEAEWRALGHDLQLPDADGAEARVDERHLAKECWRFSMAWARSRGTALVLADQAPRNGYDQTIPDPFALVARGSDGIRMLIAPGAQGLSTLLIKILAREKHLDAALRSPANRVICPPDQLPALRAALLQPDCPETILRSHLVDTEAHLALVVGDLNTFFESRRAAILNAEISWVKARGGKVDLILEPRTYAQG